jgi:hypothetical protein
MLRPLIDPFLPSSAPWVFEKRIYGIPHCLIHRDGRVIGSHLGLPNGPIMAEAPAMAALLRDLVAGGQFDALRAKAPAILGRIDRGRVRGLARATSSRGSAITAPDVFESRLGKTPSSLPPPICT